MELTTAKTPVAATDVGPSVALAVIAGAAASTNAVIVLACTLGTFVLRGGGLLLRVPPTWRTAVEALLRFAAGGMGGNLCFDDPAVKIMPVRMHL